MPEWLSTTRKVMSGEDLRFVVGIERPKRKAIQMVKTTDGRAKAERMARKWIARRPDVLAAYIKDKGALVALVIHDGNTRTPFIDTVKGTIDGQPGVVIAMYKDASGETPRPEYFRVAKDDEAALTIAKRLLAEEGRTSKAVVTISSPKGFDAMQAINQTEPVQDDNQPPLHYTVRASGTKEFVVTDKAREYRDTRAAQLRAELTRLQSDGGPALG